LLVSVAVSGHQVVKIVVTSVTVILSGTELRAELLKGRTKVLLASVITGTTVVTVERLEKVLSIVVPLLISVAVRGHQVVKIVVISVTVAFPTAPVLVVDTPDILTAAELLLGAGVDDVTLVYKAEVWYAEDVERECGSVERDSKWTEVGFDKFSVEVGGEVVFVRISALETGDMEVSLTESVERADVVEAEVAFCLVDAREREALAV